MSEERTYSWRLTHDGEGGITLDLGDDLADLSEDVGVTPITRTIGGALIKIGTQFLQSAAVASEGEDW